ncbi:MAG: LysM peptidoglycan-binding domain-containing protein [Bacteroidota bacterium]
MKVLYGTILVCLLSSLQAFSISGDEDTTKNTFSSKEQKRLSGLEKLFSNDYHPNDPTSKLTVVAEAEDLFKQRLAKLNNTTPFEFVYNDIIKSYIRVYANGKRSTTSSILGLSQMYFPLFEEHLAKNDLPLELKYLAVVESALHAKAKSHASAVGLWQFIPSTGKLYGLKINSHLDERSDPIKATQAACKYLKSLYNIFGNWELALAAYNSGPGTVNRAIRLSGGKRTYWEIYDHLPKETRGYVPAFIAVNYIMTYYKEHGINPASPDFRYCDFDTVTLYQNANLAHIANTINEPLEVLQFLNPSLKTNTIPASNSPYCLTLPRDKMDSYAANFSKFRTFAKENLARVEVLEENDTKITRKIHRVKKGETLSAISKKYNVSLDDLKSWNNINGSRLSLGQQIAIKSTITVSKSKVPVKLKMEDAQLAQKITKGSEKKSEPISKGSSKTRNEEVLLNKSAAKTAVQEHSTDDATLARTETEKLRPSEPEVSLDAFAKFHVVEKGDTLWSISQQYAGLTVSDLKKMNNLNNASLKPGQKLIVSVGG